MAHTRAWDNSQPEASDMAGFGYQDLQYFRVDTQERMSQTHKWSSSTTVDGEHLYDLVYDAGNSGTSFLNIELDNGQTQLVTLTGNVTFTFSVTTQPPTSGSYKYARSLTLYIIQDGTGGRTVTWPSSVKWPWDVTPAVDTTLSKLMIFQFFTLNGGTRWYGSFVGDKYTV